MSLTQKLYILHKALINFQLPIFNKTWILLIYQIDKASIYDSSNPLLHNM